MQSISTIADAVATRLSHWVTWISGVGLVLMTLMITWQVIGRYVFNSTPVWSEILALITMTYFVFLAAAVGVHQQYHVAIRWALTLFSDRTIRVVDSVMLILVAVFATAMIWCGVELVGYTTNHTIPTLGATRSIAYWHFPLSGALMLVFALVRLFSTVPKERKPGEWN